jgi:hypothetical protein
VRMRLSLEQIIGLAIILLAIFVSPFALMKLTGRGDFPFRVNFSSSLLSLFLILLGSSALVSGKLRRTLFVCLLAVAPLAFVGVAELIAIRAQLANRILRIEDYSVLANYSRFPAAHFMSQSSGVPNVYPFRYRPFESPYVRINELGLRTVMPSRKKPGEWRVALTGGSTAWGTAVPDEDTIPAFIQDLTNRHGLNVRVLNFGMPQRPNSRRTRSTSGVSRSVSS